MDGHHGNSAMIRCTVASRAKNDIDNEALQCEDVCLCVALQWKAPGAFLDEDVHRSDGRLPLAPPQVYEMHNLRTFTTLDDLLAECKKRRKFDGERWMPVYRLCRDAVLFLLPGVWSLFHSLNPQLLL